MFKVIINVVMDHFTTQEAAAITEVGYHYTHIISPPYLRVTFGLIYFEHLFKNFILLFYILDILL